MEKPKPKKEVAINHQSKLVGVITFWATQDALEDIREFGNLLPESAIGEDGYWLKIDGRYDFDEVVKYIESYG